MEAAWAVKLGRPPEEFWLRTPREVQAYFDAYHEAQRLENYRAGTVAASCLNAQRTDKKQKHWTWEDFFPHERKPMKVRSAEETLAEFERNLNELEREGAIKVNRAPEN